MSLLPFYSHRQWRNTVNMYGHLIYHRSTPLFLLKSELSSNLTGIKSNIRGNFESSLVTRTHIEKSRFFVIFAENRLRPPFFRTR